MPARDREPLRSWKAFGRSVRKRAEPLLLCLPAFENAVLVAGCQRSGTTALTRVIAGSAGFSRFAYTHDDELDAAQILAGVIECPPGQRRCFQTTYLNERFSEYWTTPGNFRLIWVIREPIAVVRSMVHNWRRFALNELFLACGVALATERERSRVRRFGPWSIPPARRACLSYVAKTSQIAEIAAKVPPERLRVVDYHDLVRHRDETLARLFEFIGEPYRTSYGAGLHDASVGRSDGLSARTRSEVDSFCGPAYQAATCVGPHLIVASGSTSRRA
jgi:hypothetical protein